MAVINIPTPLRKFAGDKSQFESHGETVEQVIQYFAEENPEIKGHLYNADGSLRKFMRIYLGDTDIKSLDNEKTLVSQDSEINIIPAIAGGLK